MAGRSRCFRNATCRRVFHADTRDHPRDVASGATVAPQPPNRYARPRPKPWPLSFGQSVGLENGTYVPRLHPALARRRQPSARELGSRPANCPALILEALPRASAGGRSRINQNLSNRTWVAHAPTCDAPTVFTEFLEHTRKKRREEKHVMTNTHGVTTNQEYRNIPIATLVESPTNPRKRFDEKNLEELCC